MSDYGCYGDKRAVEEERRTEENSLLLWYKATGLLV
jgi:hypothetical protein